jgi:hypothetical protein
MAFTGASRLSAGRGMMVGYTARPGGAATPTNQEADTR